MSAFIVQDACINRILTFMMKMSRDDKGYILNDVNLLKSTSRKDATSLGEKLCTLNMKAVNHRYYGDERRGTPFCFEELPGASDAQVLKSIHCFLYQCNEGEYDKDKLFMRMQKFADELASCIVTTSDAYEKAEWG